MNKQPVVVQKGPLEKTWDSWFDFGHPSDGHDLKQKEEQRSVGFADKTSSCS